MAQDTYLVRHEGDADLANVTVSGTLDVTGATTVSGAIIAKTPVTALSTDGAVTIPDGDTTFAITKAGVCALTLADPTAGDDDGLILRFVSTTANAHTLSNASGSGFNGGGAGGDVGTFGVAIGDGIQIVAYQGVWYVLNSINVTLA